MAYTEIDKPSDYFNTVVYTADQQANRVISGVGFQPDFVWLKNRNQNVTHDLYDAVRGATKALHSNSSSAETNQPDGLIAFNSDGFTVDTSWGNYATGNSYASWNWKANGTGSSNSDGSITSTVSANTTAGFSVVKFVGNETSGATVGHGLGSVPAMIMVKKISTGSSQNWRVYHKGTDASAPQDYDLKLNLTNAKDNDNTVWNDTAPTSSVFTLGNTSSINASGATMIAYSFAEKKGFSKFGSYTGNGSTDGTFVYTGFKPAFIIVKRTDSASQWRMWDNKRNTFNVVNKALLPNDSSEEQENSSQNIDFLSNGFKLRADYADTNASGGTYIYMAFAENPFVSSTGIPGPAR